MNNQHLKNLFILILAAFFIGTSGPLGKFIAMPIPLIIWWRSFIGLVAMFIFCKLSGIKFIMFPKKERLPFIFSGLLMGGHWITYFLALKMSNVAIGMLSLFTFPVITALLEPLFGKEKFKPVHVILGCMILLGIYILAPDLDFENSYVKGLLFGLLSAVFYALRILITKQYTSKYNGSLLMTYQLVIVTIAAMPALFFYDNNTLKTQFPFVITLGIITTALGHTLFVRSLKHFSAGTASIIASVQPIFGIILAYFFLDEQPSINTALGGALILGTVIIESVLSKK